MRTFIAFIFFFACFSVDGRIQIRQTGSSTVYPFAVKVAREFSKKTEYVYPLIESTGTGDGFIDIAKTKNGNWCDIVGASRPIKLSELEKCKKAGVISMMELCIGIDGIALATQKSLKGFEDFRVQDLYAAIAMKIKNDKGVLVDNPYQKWNEINPNLPNIPIRILIPSKSHGTRDAFENLIMHGGCEIRKGNEVREISAYEVADNHHLLFDFLERNTDVVAFIAASLLQSRDHIKALRINGVEPTYLNIQNETYPLIRKLFIYFRKENYATTESLQAYVNEWFSPEAIGEHGYLTKMGLVSLPEGTKNSKIL